jgi:hypothetical protein
MRTTRTSNKTSKIFILVLLSGEAGIAAFNKNELADLILQRHSTTMFVRGKACHAAAHIVN